MLIVSSKSVYNLLEKFYQRRSLNTFVYGDDMPENAFDASKVFAMKVEDYHYLSVMEKNKDNLDAKYVLFIDKIVNNLPFVFDKEKDFNLSELAGLSYNSPRIDKIFFEDLIISQSEVKGIDSQKCIDFFNNIRNILLHQGKEAP